MCQKAEERVYLDTKASVLRLRHDGSRGGSVPRIGVQLHKQAL